jgi:membrane-associated phospholipid phosphatase
MKTFLKQNFIFILTYGILLLSVTIVLLQNGKVQIHKSINSIVGNSFFDIFFKYITHLGDGLFAIVIVLIGLFFNVKKSMYVLITYISASLISTIIKNYIYLDTCRPSFAFQYFVREPLQLISGVEMNTFHSFPSGHSTTAFAVFMCFLFMSQKIGYKFCWFILALLAAFSRTYLSQHWLVDIYFGSLIGFSFSVFFYFMFYIKPYSNTLNHGIVYLLKKK